MGVTKLPELVIKTSSDLYNSFNEDFMYADHTGAYYNNNKINLNKKINLEKAISKYSQPIDP